MTRMSSSSVLCVNVPRLIFCMVMSLISPIHPPAPLPDLGGGIQAALQKVIVMKSPSGALADSPIFLHLHAGREWWGL